MRCYGGKNMDWEIILAIHLAIWTFGAAVLKQITKKIPSAKALTVIFFICAASMFGYNLIFVDSVFVPFFLMISAVGFVNSYGSYCQLRAYKFSFSKTNLFLPLSSVITAGLAALFLEESKIYNSKVLFGVLFLLIAAVCLASKKNQKSEKGIGIRWLIFALGMALIWGAAFFMVKFFSFTIPRETFLLYWYTGAFFGTLSILGIGRIMKMEENQKQKTENISLGKAWWLVLPASALILFSLATQYWTFQLAPAGAVESIRRFGMSLLPIPIGWYLFKEKRELTKVQTLGFILGIIGTSLTIFGIY